MRGKTNEKHAVIVPNNYSLSFLHPSDRIKYFAVRLTKTKIRCYGLLFDTVCLATLYL